MISPPHYHYARSNKEEMTAQNSCFIIDMPPPHIGLIKDTLNMLDNEGLYYFYLTFSSFHNCFYIAVDDDVDTRHYTAADHLLFRSFYFAKDSFAAVQIVVSSISLLVGDYCVMPGFYVLDGQMDTFLPISF